MRRSLPTRVLLIGLALSGPALGGPEQDTDDDGVWDVLDNCVLVANAPPADCDTDRDGFGNACDGDFDNSGSNTASADFSNHFVPDFTGGGADSGVGTDMDCSGTVNANDFSVFFVPQFTGTGTPGPSGLSCAGSVPCP